MTDVTESLPDAVDVVKEYVRADRVVLEGEVVGVGSTGHPLPFQDLMRRFRRVEDIPGAVERVPVRLFLFDILLFDGDTLIDENYERRYQFLLGAVDWGFWRRGL